MAMSVASIVRCSAEWVIHERGSVRAPDPPRSHHAATIHTVSLFTSFIFLTANLSFRG